MTEPYIETVSGKKVHFLNATEDEIDIKDIAFSLANQCRFNGHIPFYSVAEHSLMVCGKGLQEEKLACLLHDAAEAYLSDIPSPVKQYLPDYKKIEDNLQAVINKKFGINTFTESIKIADWNATCTEAYYLLDSKGVDWLPAGFEPQTKYKPHCLPPPTAYKLFLEWYYKLTASPIILAT